MIAVQEVSSVTSFLTGRTGELVRTRGILGAAGYCIRNFGWLAERLRWLISEAAYDRKHGVQTSRVVAATDLGIDPRKIDEVGVNALGNAYRPTPAGALTEMLKAVKVHYPDYTFIDLGSGMGRVVLMAAEFSFRKVIGVEFSEELHLIATENLARSSRSRRAAAVELVWQDAREYVFPEGNCVVYMANPFQESVMRPVLENLRRAFESRTADLYVIYFIPKQGALLDASPFLGKLKSAQYYSIYQGRRG